MRFEAVLFDCDGVLVDSEPITNGVLRDMLAEAGWVMSPEECMRRFVGKAVKDEAALIEANTGRPLTEDWLHAFRLRRNEALLRDLQAVRNVHDAVGAVHARLQGRIACASGADRYKVEIQLGKVGLLPFFEGRIFSGHEMPRSKPAPDVYLAAMASLGARATGCAVVEDTPTGVRAGVDAGALVLGYVPPHAPPDTAQQLREAGALHLFDDMAELPALLARA
ncbi:MAG: HAD family phosphatase [Betaproteobacteria bacterium]|jgi:HAD superfamily hydrolase (TIGR01509 family)|nr:HAD family phosphatase [Betaproteobacteria bacterium]NBS47033.1 HAD family phosphatase [Betaproteobacteria bacterium]